MKKNLLLIIALFVSAFTFSQNDYSKGFQNGYKQGYCYNDYGCISPTPPISPIPLIGENNDSYQDGYNRGFKAGLEDKKANKSNNNSYQSGQRDYIPLQQQNQNSGPGISIKNIQTESTYKRPDYNSLLRAREKRNAEAVSQMNKYKAFYESLNAYPETIRDGWHKVMSMNNKSYYQEAKVYVLDNKVTKYVVEDWFYLTVSYSPTISRAKTTLQLTDIEMAYEDFVDIYFLEDITNPNVYVDPPSKLGKVCFWSSMKRGGTIMVYVDDNYVGSLESYFKAGTPNCEQDGTLTYKYKAGTYNFRATNNRNTWKGTITISPDTCTLQGLND